MEQREVHDVGTCYKLYLFVIKTLASQAMKTVTLGGTPSSHYGSSSTHEVNITQRGFGSKPETSCSSSCEGSVSQTERAERKNIPCRNNIDESVLGELPHAPKKMVSINDNVEEIILPSKERTMSVSLDQQEYPKPLPSILKVCSNLNDKSNSC